METQLNLNEDDEDSITIQDTSQCTGNSIPIQDVEDSDLTDAADNELADVDADGGHNENMI